MKMSETPLVGPHRRIKSTGERTVAKRVGQNGKKTEGEGGKKEKIWVGKEHLVAVSAERQLWNYNACAGHQP